MRSLIIPLALMAAAPVGAQQVAANTGRVYELSEVEVLPRPQNVPEFRAALQQAYPPLLRDAGVDGTVHVAFVVGADGQPSEVRVLSTTQDIFSEPSVQAVSLLRFTPAQVGGQPVAVRVEQPITWVSEGALAAVEGAALPNSAAADTAEGYELAEVEELPRPTNPRDFGRELARLYPPVLRDRGQGGLVIVRFRVEQDGSTSHATVVSATHSELAAPTLRAVAVLRFRPGRVNGRPVRTWVEQPVQWSVSGVGIVGGSPARMEGIEPGGLRRGRPSDVLRPRVGEPAPCSGGRPC